MVGDRDADEDAVEDEDPPSENSKSAGGTVAFSLDVLFSSNGISVTKQPYGPVLAGAPLGAHRSRTSSSLSSHEAVPWRWWW